MHERGHETIDHAADMGIRGWGGSLEEAFEETALAMFELMADIDGLRPSRELSVSSAGSDAEELLVEFLNALLSAADIEEVVLVGVAVETARPEADGWRLRARATGAPRGEAEGRLHTEVKAATYYGVSVRETERGIWEAQCVVDL